MPFTHGKDAKVYVSGRDLSGFLTEWSVSGEADTVEVSTLGDSSKEYVAGLKDATMSGSGIFDAAGTATVDAVLGSALGPAASIVATFYPQGDTFGLPGFGMAGIEIDYSPVASLDDAVKVAVEARSSVGPEAVLSHAGLAARTTSGNSTSNDNAASSAAGGVGYLHVAAGSGTTPNLVAKVQHSVDNSVWVDLITFATVTTAPVTERQAVAGTVNRYTRAAWTISGTTPSFTFNVAFGRK
jgi:hypothetical protein